MARFLLPPLFFLLFSLSSSAAFNSSSYPSHRSLLLVQQQPLILRYHNGPLLKGNLTIQIIWYGQFSSSQRASISSFITSLSPSSLLPPPSVSSWWATTSTYPGGPAVVSLGRQTFDSYSLGRSLTSSSLRRLARRAAAAPPVKNSIFAIFTSSDVTVDGFCMSSCGLHSAVRNEGIKFPYIWVGNAAAQCAGQCAWPYALPEYGPPGAAALLPPSGDVGVDGMVINLATLMAGVVTNPFGQGFFQGPAAAPLEAVTACTGIFGSGAYPGYPGKLLVDGNGASYNARGVDGREFLLPAMWDPKTFDCATLV